MNKEQMYLVSYSIGEYDSHRIIDLFVTADKKKAMKYVSKFNKMLKKWNTYYQQYENKNSFGSWIQEEYVEKYFDRWYRVRNINLCYWEEIELR